MKLAFGSDERNTLTDAILAWLEEHGHAVERHGPLAGDGQNWTMVAKQVAESVARGEVQEGILCCWTGTGVTIAANKVPGIRAALCGDAETARGARLWNNANMLCLSLRSTSIAVAKEILERWFDTTYVPNTEDDACLADLYELEQAYSCP